QEDVVVGQAGEAERVGRGGVAHTPILRAPRTGGEVGLLTYRGGDLRHGGLGGADPVDVPQPDRRGLAAEEEDLDVAPLGGGGDDLLGTRRGADDGEHRDLPRWQPRLELAVAR